MDACRSYHAPDPSSGANPPPVPHCPRRIAEVDYGMASDLRARLGIIRRPHFTRILLLLMLVVFLVIFLVEASLYVSLRRLYADTVVDLQFQLIDQSQRTTETFLYQAQRQALTTAAMADLDVLLNTQFELITGFDRFRRVRSTIDLVLNSFASDVIHSVYAYSATQDAVLGAGGFVDTHRFSDAEFVIGMQDERSFFSWRPQREYAGGCRRPPGDLIRCSRPANRSGEGIVLGCQPRCPVRR